MDLNSDIVEAFSKELIEKQLEELKINKPKYVLGVDMYDKDVFAYCLVRHIGDNVEVVLAKKMHDNFDFITEATNLAKYFNANIVIAKGE